MRTDWKALAGFVFLVACAWAAAFGVTAVMPPTALRVAVIAMVVGAVVWARYTHLLVPDEAGDGDE